MEKGLAQQDIRRFEALLEECERRRSILAALLDRNATPLIILQDCRLRILDLGALRKLANFDSSSLHLDVSTSGESRGTRPRLRSPLAGA